MVAKKQTEAMSQNGHSLFRLDDGGVNIRVVSFGLGAR